MKVLYSDSVLVSMRSHYLSLPERLRRQYAAVELRKLGVGGQTYLQQVLGISPKTLRRGQRELAANEHLPIIESHKQRRFGGGRKKICEV